MKYHSLIVLKFFAGRLLGPTVSLSFNDEIQFTISSIVVFFCLGFLSQTFTIERTAGEEGGYFFNSSLSLPPTSQTLRH